MESESSLMLLLIFHNILITQMVFKYLFILTVNHVMLQKY